LDTDDLQNNILQLTNLAFQYSDDGERYRGEIDEVNAEISLVKEKIVKLESQYMNCERRIQDEFALELKRKHQNVSSTNDGMTGTPNTTVNLENDINQLNQKVRHIIMIILFLVFFK
jgi:hypothetical protein